MKKLIYTMTVSCLFFGLGSCDHLTSSLKKCSFYN